MSQIKIFTDGSSRGNPGRGGWGAIIVTNNEVFEIGGREEHTTNNRMELTAVLEALRKTTFEDSITVHTDSKYVLQGSKTWLTEWKKNGWITKGKKEVLNKDIWVALDDLLNTKTISWKLLPGHSGIPANERCDVIATSFADGRDPRLYSGDIKNYFVDISVTTQTKEKKKRKATSSAKPYSYVSMVKGVIKTHKTWAECEKRVKGVKNTKFKKSFSKQDEASIIAEWRKTSHS